MDDLVRWYGEQLDEDERIARGADPGPWKSDSLGRHDQSAIKLGAPTSLIQFDGSRAAANGMHVARHDPARVLREIDAKRHNLAELEAAEGAMDEASRNRDTVRYNEVRAGWVVLRRVVRRDAAVYADRPGYRQEWRS